MHPDQQVTTPLFWIMEAYRDRLESDPAILGGDKKMAKVTGFVMGMRTGAMDTLTAVSSFGQQPLAIVALMSALIKLDLFVLTLKAGFEYVNIYLGDTSTPVLQYCMVTLTTITAPIVYQGLLEFAGQIANPFGDDWIDLPSLYMQVTTR